MHILPITILLFFFTPYLSISFAEIGVFTDAETGFHVELLEERKRGMIRKKRLCHQRRDQQRRLSSLQQLK
jgi:hypothetical protein